MSLSVDAFEALLPSFETAFVPYMAEWTLQGRRQQSQRSTTSQHGPLRTTADLLVYLKQKTMHVPFCPDETIVSWFSGSFA